MSESKVRSAVAEVINRVLSDSGRENRTMQDEDRLTVEIGLDSLDLAVLVVGLEKQLGVDPFRAGARAVATFGQLVDLYEKSVTRE